VGHFFTPTLELELAVVHGLVGGSGYDCDVFEEKTRDLCLSQ
jgi:hypothetical protein